eukprot:Nk52_evm29s221 gene=Nk52_evmTU29s221
MLLASRTKRPVLDVLANSFRSVVWGKWGKKGYDEGVSRLYKRARLSTLVGSQARAGLRGATWRSWKMRAARVLYPFRPSVVPPYAEMKPSITVIHDQKRVDNFAWLENQKDQSVIEYLVSENNYVDHYMQSTESFQEKIYEELASRVDVEDESVPEIIDGYIYYMKVKNGGDDLHVYCRKKIDISGEAPEEEILLDLNDVLNHFQYKYAALGLIKLSHDHNMMAFTIDNSGSETFSAYIVDLRGKTTKMGHLVEGIPNAVSVEWASDGKTLFYTVANSLKRPFRIYRHTLGEPPSNDELVYEETDDRYIVDVSRTKDKKFVTLNSNSRTSSEVRVVDAYNPKEAILIHPREKGLEYFVDHRKDKFYIVTNADGATNYKVVSVEDHAPQKENWVNLVDESADFKIEDMDLFENFCVLYEKSMGLPVVRVVPLMEGRKMYWLKLPEQVCVLEPGANQNFSSNTLRFSISSPITPLSTFDFDMLRKEMTMLKSHKIAGYPEVRSRDYVCERVYTKSFDGAPVPITIVRKKNVSLDGTAPMLVSGYGSYGLSMEPEYHSERLFLLSRGWIIAFAHVRGGSEMGRGWYDDAKLMSKHKSFKDFISCINYLHDAGFSNPKATAVKGVSAGGLLMGAVMNEAPHLFSSAIMKVPYVDVLTSMLDPNLPLTVHEYDEWGNPHTSKEVYRYIKSYSPYENIKEQDYPSMLVTSSLKDTRVSYWQPAKYVAKLRHYKTDNNPLLLKTDWASGHFGSAGCHNHLKDTAFEYAFLFHTLGLPLK